MTTLALAALAFAQPAAAQGEDIVVIGRLVGSVQMTLGRDAAGRTTCSLNRSSGNPRVDAAVCRKASRCLPRRPLPGARMEACIADARRAVVREWRRAR